MAAPDLRRQPRQPYSRSQIEHLFQTAYTSFKGAKTEADAQNKPLIIHTGNWGCGVFKNNLALAAVVQLLAADASGVDEIVYHTVDAAGHQAFAKARKWVENLRKQKPIDIEMALALLQKHEFTTG